MKLICLFVLRIRLETLLLLITYKGPYGGWAVEHEQSHMLFQTGASFLKNTFKLATFHISFKMLLE